MGLRVVLDTANLNRCDGECKSQVRPVGKKHLTLLLV